MRRTALAFSTASFLPVPMLGLATVTGGVWAWIALFYLTLFTFAMDELIAMASAEAKEPREFPAADALLVALALAQFTLLWLVIAAFGRGMEPSEGIALFLASGLFFGQIGNSTAHELIHRGNRGLHNLGKWLYISVLFGHHTSSHRLVHHSHVASDRDPNSARRGEGYYRFALRAWAGSFQAGLQAENARMSGRSFWQHPYVSYVLGAVGFMALAFWLGGRAGLIGYIALAGYAQSQLLISDYVQHYGLRRAVDGGTPEPVGARHSWNAPHVFSAHMMLNAPRHSDHHAHPARPYPELTLGAPDQIPTLPYSLPAMSVLALIPPVWRRLMDPRVALWQADRDRPGAA